MSGSVIWCTCASTGGQDLHFIQTNCNSFIQPNPNKSNNFYHQEWYHPLSLIDHNVRQDVMHLRRNSCGQDIHPNNFIKTKSLKKQSKQKFQKKLYQNKSLSNGEDLHLCQNSCRSAAFFPFSLSLPSCQSKARSYFWSKNMNKDIKFPFPSLLSKKKQDHVCDQRKWNKTKMG